MARRTEPRQQKILMISAVAERFSIHPQTLRLYEREGLIRPTRSSGNTRLYDEETIERLEIILTLTRELGVNLAGVEVILNMREQMDRMQSRHGPGPRLRQAGDGRSSSRSGSSACPGAGEERPLGPALTEAALRGGPVKNPFSCVVAMLLILLPAAWAGATEPSRFGETTTVVVPDPPGDRPRFVGATTEGRPRTDRVDLRDRRSLPWRNIRRGAAAAATILAKASQVDFILLLRNTAIDHLTRQGVLP